MAEFQQDMSRLTYEQMKTVKSLIQFGQAWADQVMMIMKNSGLWEKGFQFKCMVSPKASVLTEEVQFYRSVVDGDAIYDEEIERHKGVEANFTDWQTLSPCTSREFIHLFDDKKSGAGSQDGKADEKPLPPNGLWIGTDPYSGILDCR